MPKCKICNNKSKKFNKKACKKNTKSGNKKGIKIKKKKQKIQMCQK